MADTRRVKILALVAALVPAAALAQSLPIDAPVTVAGIETVCTGIGLDARTDPRWLAYGLKVEIAGPGGAYLADEQVTIRKGEEQGVRKYGFHGLSYDYIAGRLHEVAPELARGRVIAAHLGSGASLCAMRDGKSVDTTMGFSPLEGLVMATRPGSLDAGVLLYLLDQGWTAKRLQDLLYHRSGLLGVSGLSGDMRTLEESSDARAGEAIDLFVFRLNQAVGAMAASLGGVDGIVFTGGIGENSAAIRKMACEHAAWLGLTLDEAANAAGTGRISLPDSCVAAWVIPTDEELVIARQTASLLRV